MRRPARRAPLHRRSAEGAAQRGARFYLLFFLSADEAETGTQPAQRRQIQGIGVDPPLACDDQLDRAPFALETHTALDASAGLGLTIPAAVDAKVPYVSA